MTQLIGILNLTPDSFSGDGLRHSATDAVRHMDQLIHDGAWGIDIGAESTRPGATLLSCEEEWKRFKPVMDAVKERAGKVRFSIDTRHVETAERFLNHIGKHNASSIWINDVSGGADKRLYDLAERYGAGLIVMHSLTVPADPKITLPADTDAVETICQWAAETIMKLGRNIIIDPGIGFGKTAQQSLEILIRIARVQSLGTPVLIGHSRKSFLSLFTDRKASERDPETLFFSGYLARQEVDYLRVHDVKNHTEMLKKVRAGQ